MKLVQLSIVLNPNQKIWLVFDNCGLQPISDQIMSEQFDAFMDLTVSLVEPYADNMLAIHVKL